MYSIKKINFWNFLGLLKVSDILYKCGKDMAEKYNLHHWNNSHFKNLAIVFLGVLKNNVYLVFDKENAVATFQTRKINQSYLFQKLATSPEFSGKGIGSFCLNEIERLGKNERCDEIICEVYDKSEHAKAFYEHKGYVICGTTETIKYKELKLKKEL